MTITVRYSSIDGFSSSRSFKTLAAARRFAVKWVGEFPEIGTGYAVAADGVGKVTVRGATLAQLFGQDTQADGYTIDGVFNDGDSFYRVSCNGRSLAAYDTREEAEEHVFLARQNDAELRADERALARFERGF